jgi:hypothetical protein
MENQLGKIPGAFIKKTLLSQADRLDVTLPVEYGE